MIDSMNNPKIKALGKLMLTKYRKKEQKFIVEGAHLVQEAMQAGVLIEAFSIIDKEGYTMISPSVMKNLCHTDTMVDEIGLCRRLEKREIADKVLILDGIQDPGNMGTLMRSACAFGFDTIFVGNGSVDIYNDKVIRASQGAIFKLNFLFGDIPIFVKQLDHKVFGTNVKNGRSIKEIPSYKKVAIILGNEGNGISREVENLNLENIYLPMQNTESLNVAVAGSIIMFEMK